LTTAGKIDFSATRKAGAGGYSFPRRTAQDCTGSRAEWRPPQFRFLSVDGTNVTDTKRHHDRRSTGPYTVCK